MSFHNGIPITVVAGLQTLRVPTETTSRRRAEEDARLEKKGATSCQAIE